MHFINSFVCVPMSAEPCHIVRRFFYDIELLLRTVIHCTLVDTREEFFDRLIFERAQALYQAKSSKITHSPREQYPFTMTILCGNCGTYFKRKMSKDITYWVCRKHDRQKDACVMEQIPESQIEEAVLRLYYNLKHHGEPILSQMITSLLTIRNRRMLWSRMSLS